MSLKASNGAILTSPLGQPIAHLVGLYLAVIRLVKHQIKPIFVFDVLDVSGATEKARRKAQMKARHEEESMQLLTSLGMPVIRADGDAATLCALLAHQGMAYAAAVDDLTVLCFGGKLLCNLMDPPGRGLPIQEIDPSIACSDLGITLRQEQEFHDAQTRHQFETPPPIPNSCRDLHWQAPIVQDVLNIMKQKAQFKEDRVRRDCRTIADAMNGD
ncbi:hypothetical protein BC940DRAFT_329756 [Gongronella butleri]|nr:hypothetical protein BC940DRAFT_329756 [Gongronella butleri]